MSRPLAWLSRLLGIRRADRPVFAPVLAHALHGDRPATWRISTFARSLDAEPNGPPSRLPCHGAAFAAPDPKE